MGHVVPGRGAGAVQPGSSRGSACGGFSVAQALVDDLVARAFPLQAVAAIARPEAFFTMLRARGLNLIRTEALPDHYDFDSWKALSGKHYTIIFTKGFGG